MQAAVGGPDAFAQLPIADFSRSILERAADRLAISRLPDGIGSDRGTPERVRESLLEAKMTVPECLAVSGPPRDGVPAAIELAS